jgi:hypothetical protein
VAAETVAEEGRLVDDVGTGAQRLLGLRRGGLQRSARPVLTTSGRTEVERVRSTVLDDGARPGIRIRRSWTPHAVVDGDALMPELANELAQLVPLSRSIRESQ